MLSGIYMMGFAGMKAFSVNRFGTMYINYETRIFTGRTLSVFLYFNWVTFLSDSVCPMVMTK